jgi:hypothetical protein
VAKAYGFEIQCNGVAYRSGLVRRAPSAAVSRRIPLEGKTKKRSDSLMKNNKQSISEADFSDPALAVRALLAPVLREIRQAREKQKQNSAFLKTLAEFKFVPGETYSNRQRRYTVLAVRGPKLIVRYDDGTVDELTEEIQRRIITNMALERGPDNHSPTSSTLETS